MAEAAVYSVLMVVLVVGLGLQARAQKRARGDTLDAWCARAGWRRETDRATAKTVGRRIAGAEHDIENVIVGTTSDGREAVGVTSSLLITVGGGDSESSYRREETHLAVRVRGDHPYLAVGRRPAFSWSSDRHERRTGHPHFDRRYRLLAVDGTHAATLLPWSVLDRLAAGAMVVPWQLHGGWLTCSREGLELSALEWLLAYVGDLAPDLEASAELTGPAGSPGPAPRTR